MKFILLIVIPVIFLSFASKAQDSNDSLNNKISRASRRFSTDTNTVSLMSNLENVSIHINSVSQNLARKFDISGIENSLDEIEQKLDFSNSYINSPDKHISFRLLRVHSIFLAQVKNTLDNFSEQLQDYNKEIEKVENAVSSFIADSNYKKITSDSLTRNIYLTQYYEILKRWLKADSLNKERQFNITRIQSRLTNDYLKLSLLTESVSVKIENFNQSVFKASDMPLFNAKSSDYNKNIFEILEDSAKTGSTIMLYYLSSHWKPVVISLLLCLLFTSWLIFIRLEYKKHFISYIRESNIQLKYLSNSPLFGSLLLTFTFATFFFPTPPEIFVELLWTILGLILTVLFFSDKNISVQVRFTWAAFFIMFRIVALINLFLYASFAERWLLLLINISCIALGFFIIRVNRSKQIFHLQRTQWVIYISGVLHLAAIAGNILGLFNLAKILTATATFAVFTAATLRVFTDAAREALTFQLAMLKRKFAATHEQSLNRIYHFISHLLNVFAVMAWFIIFLHYLNVLEYIEDYIIHFLYKSLSIGSIAFTPGSVLLFIVIILASAFVSNLISIITDITASQNTKYTFLSNAKLIIKLAVITIGVLLAFIATGIPIDKIAIVLGALSVGIGFGLQNLVSNLVSGVMITLEHPVRIGDFIEVGGHKGIIKEIGIRSLKIYTANGADVIIPNSDVLSQHVVNRTLSTPHERMELEIFIEDSNNLNKAKTLITQILRDHPLLLKDPPPLVVVNSLKNAAIGFTCYCWCENVELVALAKSVVLENIHDEFKKQSITIKDDNLHFVSKPGL